MPIGKGTQCAKLVHDYSFVHLSGSFLLRLTPDCMDCLTDGDALISRRSPARRTEPGRIRIRRFDQNVYY